MDRGRLGKARQEVVVIGPKEKVMKAEPGQWLWGERGGDGLEKYLGNRVGCLPSQGEERSLFTFLVHNFFNYVLGVKSRYPTRHVTVPDSNYWRCRCICLKTTETSLKEKENSLRTVQTGRHLLMIKSVGLKLEVCRIVKDTTHGKDGFVYWNLCFYDWKLKRAGCPFMKGNTSLYNRCTAEVY